jgi:hypothetical protein
VVLRPGVVCDRCNNYFASKVEQPFLDSAEMRLLRLSQGIVSKKGRIPRVFAAAGEIPVELISTGWGEPTVIAFDRAEDIGRLVNTQTIVGPQIGTPTGATSRFIAKVAIGSLAAQVQNEPAKLDEFVDFEPLDSLRNHARYGSPRSWSVLSHHAYAAGQLWDDGNGGLEQRKWESTTFVVDDGSAHFAVAFFGREFVIPLEQSDLRAFRRWILMHPGESPLLSGPFSHERSLMRSTMPRRQRGYMVLKAPRDGRAEPSGLLDHSPGRLPSTGAESVVRSCFA